MLGLKIHSCTSLSCLLARAVLPRWEQSQNVPLILQYATISLKVLNQLSTASPRAPVGSGLCRCVLVCGCVPSESSGGECGCKRLLHFFSQEQEGIIMSDWISSHDVCNTIC